MRKRCACGEIIGYYRLSGTQRPVFCNRCHVFQNYNASRVETGEPTTSVRSLPDIPSSQRQRILERDGFRCVMCGRTPQDGITLQVDHMVSRADCAKYGLAKPNEVNDDENLVTSCHECNIGHGSRSIAPVALLAISVRIAQNRKRHGGG